MVKIVNGVVVGDDGKPTGQASRTPGGGGAAPSESWHEALTVRLGSVTIHPMFTSLGALFFLLTLGWKGLALFIVLVAGAKYAEMRGGGDEAGSSGARASGNATASGSNAAGPSRPRQSGPNIKGVKDLPKTPKRG